MSNLPSLPRQDVGDTRTGYLAAWLAHYQTHRDLGPADYEARPHPVPPNHDRPARAELRPGCVVLLTAELCPEEPRYVVLLARGDNASWQVVPFSRYPVPATDGEMLTGLPWTPLKVLCAWNTRRLPQTALRACYPVDALSPEAMQDLLAVAGAPHREATRGPELADRCGTPLYHPLDPRHDYLDDERERFEAIETRAQGEPTGRGCVYPFPSHDTLKKAAEEPETDYEP